MSAVPQPNPPVVPEPTYSEEDQRAMFASVVWFHEQKSAGNLNRYEGMHVAVVGETIIDADPDPDELIRRLEKLGTDRWHRAVVQYVPGPNDWYW